MRVLKNAWPTRLISALPPARSTTSRTAREARTSYRIVAPGSLRRTRLGEQRGEEVAGHELARVVDEEAAVAVAVPGDAELGARLAHLLDDEAAVLLEQRVRLVVRELAVWLPVGRHLLDRQAVEQRTDHRARHAVAAVEHDPERPDRARNRSSGARPRGTPPPRPPRRSRRVAPRAARARRRRRSRAARRCRSRR